MGRSSSCGPFKKPTLPASIKASARLQRQYYPQMSPSEHERRSGRVLQNDLERLDARRPAALGGDERRVEAHGPVRDLELRWQLREKAPHDDVGTHSDHRLERTGHADVGHVGRATRKYTRIGGLHVRVRPEHGRHPSVQVVTLSLIHISEPTRLGMISYAVFCLKKK